MVFHIAGADMKLNEPGLDGQSNYLLTLKEIVSWQINHGLPPPENGKNAPIYAELPALQRGAVWKAGKVEAFWDSLIRGFPIGSFLLSPYDERLGHAEYKLGSNAAEINHVNRFHLLDGQQRATAVAIGFLDVWTSSQYIDGPVLWIDLGNSSPNGDRAFLFRLLTRSHPWGYSARDPETRLTHAHIRSALSNFRKVALDPTARGATLPLQFAWPWDAVCPMPVSILLKAAAHDDWHAELLRLLLKLPMWNDDATVIDGSNIVAQWEKALEGEFRARLEWVIAALREELRTRTIPAIIMRERPLPLALQEVNSDERSGQSVDAVETLFVRINTAGVPLSAEDLIYSSLKAVWPGATVALESLLGKQRIVAPEHMVTFLYRLHLAFSEGRNNDKAPLTPDVAAFRTALKDTAKLNAFQDFVVQRARLGTITQLFDLVRLTGVDDKSAWKLPPTLAAGIFSGGKGLELLFISAAWILRLEKAGIRIAQLSAKQQRRSLGFLVAMAEFAELPEQCVTRLWDALHSLADDKLLPDFFNAKRYQLLLPIHNGGPVMLPLVPPAVLAEVIRCRVTGGQKGFPGPNHADFWRSESVWQHYSTRLVPDNFSQLESGLREWLHGQKLDGKESDTADEATLTERRRLAWKKFFDRLWDKRALVDYAQRGWLMRWFPDYDPTLPGQMEDVNRPWDYDHIHPQGLLCNEMPGAIRDWHRSLGNLRAWPLELNRSDQKDAPADKLNTAPDQDDRNFGMNAGTDVRKASFIDEDQEWQFWRDSVPVASQFDQRYLAKYPDYEHAGRALILATTSRFCAIYAHWFDQLALGELQRK